MATPSRLASLTLIRDRSKGHRQSVQTRNRSATARLLPIAPAHRGVLTSKGAAHLTECREKANMDMNGS